MVSNYEGDISGTIFDGGVVSQYISCCFVAAVPGSCRAPLKVSDVTNSSLTLSWGAPTDVGGSKLIGYTVERQEKGKDYWATCSSSLVCPLPISGIPSCH